MICQANALHIPLADESVQCVVTSPPYWSLRSYGIGAENGEIGLEESPELYVEHMVQVFREIKRVLRTDGTCWLNLGDSYAGGAVAGSAAAFRGKQGTNRGSLNMIGKANVPDGLKPKDLVGIPWRVAFALQADGWWLRSDIVWAKPNPMPESVTDRPTRAHEYVFLLAKSGEAQFWTHPERDGVRERPEPHYEWKHKETEEVTRIEPEDWRKEWSRRNLWRGHDYYYDADAIRENFADERMGNPGGGGQYSVGSGRNDSGALKTGVWNEDKSHTGRNKRTVWTVNTRPYKGAHFATFPPELVAPMVLAGTSQRGCCPECGAPWERVVERGMTAHDGETGTSYAKGTTANRLALLRQAARERGEEYVNERKALGWHPTCAHEHEPVPCVVLDPFCGSGTVGEVCRESGRQFIGLDLSLEYLREQALVRSERLTPKEAIVELPMFKGL